MGSVGQKAADKVQLMAMVNGAGQKDKIRATNTRRQLTIIQVCWGPKEKSKWYNLYLHSNTFLVKNHDQTVVFKLFSLIKKTVQSRTFIPLRTVSVIKGH